MFGLELVKYLDLGVILMVLAIPLWLKVHDRTPKVSVDLIWGLTLVTLASVWLFLTCIQTQSSRDLGGMLTTVASFVVMVASTVGMFVAYCIKQRIGRR
jgi:hypothetical protein